jgi:hypothetical protein
MHWPCSTPQKLLVLVAFVHVCIVEMILQEVSGFAAAEHVIGCSSFPVDSIVLDPLKVGCNISSGDNS